MNKRDFLKMSALTVAASGFAAGAQAKGRKPMPKFGKQYNLLFITVDDMNWSQFGFFNGVKDITANLDRLAGRSYVFDNNRTVIPICQPSREAMMTGLYPQHSGGTGFTPVYGFVPTLTMLLHDSGYYTACIHKIGHMQPDSRFPWDYKRPGKDRSPAEYETCARQAIHQAKVAHKPFFLCCNINDPHRPFYGSPVANETFDHNEEGPYKVDRIFKPEEVIVPPFLDDLPNVRKELAQYWTSTYRLDQSVGRVLKVLEENGCADNTIVVFTSDHGMPFPFAKATGYDSASRTPMILHIPGQKSGRHFKNLTENVDYLPTLLELMGQKLPSRLDGRSMLPIIRGEKYEDRKYTMTYLNTLSSGMDYATRTVQNMRYALIFSAWADGKLKYCSESLWGLTYPAMVEAAKTDPKAKARLDQLQLDTMYAFYDKEKDPGQRVNLINDPAYKAQIAEMQTFMVEEMERACDPQYDNLKIFLAGGKPKLAQYPKAYQISDHKYEFPPDSAKGETEALKLGKEIRDYLSTL